MTGTMKTRLFALLSAVIYLILGVMILVNPGTTLASFILVMGVFLLIGGVFLTIDAVRLTAIASYRIAYIIDGILLMLLGAIFVFGNTFINITILAYLLVFWFMASAIIQMYFVWSIGGIVGIVSIILNMLILIFSFLALIDPALAQGILIWYLAFEFILAGVNKLLVVFAPKRDLE